jgi:hypothetical protein
MADKNISPDRCEKKKIHDRSMMGGTYGLAFIGAAIYFIQHATSFWDGVLGILKALVWPAILVYKLLEYLHL